MSYGPTLRDRGAHDRASTAPRRKLSNPRLQILRKCAMGHLHRRLGPTTGISAKRGDDRRGETPTPRKYPPTSPKYFNQIYFAGAEEGCILTYCTKGVLRCGPLPLRPAFGSSIDFADVAQHDIQQSELLEALAQLFNPEVLPPRSRPARYGSSPNPTSSVRRGGDWSRRTDFSQPSTASRSLPKSTKRRTWWYQEGDGAVGRYDADEETARSGPGAPRFLLRLAAGRKGPPQPPLPPDAQLHGHYLNAPVGPAPAGRRPRRRRRTTARTSHPASSATSGCNPLPENERWGYPSDRTNTRSSPSFHPRATTTRSPFTLGFEDRDGAQGLHRYYDRQVRREALRERISLRLRIAPHEFEALFAPGTGAPTSAPAFRIDTGEGSSPPHSAKLTTTTPGKPP